MMPILHPYTTVWIEALVEAEGGRWPNPEGRVWVFTFEVPDGTWGVSAGASSLCRTSLSMSSERLVAVTAKSVSPSGVASRRGRCSRPPKAEQDALA